MLIVAARHLVCSPPPRKRQRGPRLADPRINLLTAATKRDLRRPSMRLCPPADGARPRRGPLLSRAQVHTYWPLIGSRGATVQGQRGDYKDISCLSCLINTSGVLCASSEAAATDPNTDKFLVVPQRRNICSSSPIKARSSQRDIYVLCHPPC